MTDITNQFLASPVSFLHKIPLDGFGMDFLGVRVCNLQVKTDDEINFAFLKKTPYGEAGALFYVLGWKQEQASLGMLGDQARFFYTGPLSGCTFAVDKNWHTPRVIHVNETHDGTMNVNGMMQTVNQQMAGSTSKLKYWQQGPNITVVQSHNRPQDYTYNIFGYRNAGSSWLGGGSWTFYQQIVEAVGPGNKVVRDLCELDTWF